MYPFTEQLIKYNSKNSDKKIGMLILDVKGNYYKQIKYYTKKYNLFKDLIIFHNCKLFEHISKGLIPYVIIISSDKYIG